MDPIIRIRDLLLSLATIKDAVITLMPLRWAGRDRTLSAGGDVLYCVGAVPGLRRTPQICRERPDCSGYRASGALNIMPRRGSVTLTACSANGRLPQIPAKPLCRARGARRAFVVRRAEIVLAWRTLGCREPPVCEESGVGAFGSGEWLQCCGGDVELERRGVRG